VLGHGVLVARLALLDHQLHVPAAALLEPADGNSLKTRRSGCRTARCGSSRRARAGGRRVRQVAELADRGLGALARRRLDVLLAVDDATRSSARRRRAPRRRGSSGAATTSPTRPRLVPTVSAAASRGAEDTRQKPSHWPRYGDGCEAPPEGCLPG
jgi:hypothetical protein